jgi:hypothetical protein
VGCLGAQDLARVHMDNRLTAQPHAGDEPVVWYKCCSC